MRRRAESVQAPTRCSKYPTYAVGAGYFETMEIAMKEGREFRAGSRAPEADLVILKGVFPRLKQWPNGSDLGETLRIGTGWSGRDGIA